jgi:hypothetical protein
MKKFIEILKINEEGSSGGLAGLSFNFVIFSFLCIIIGRVFDLFVNISNGYIASGTISQDSVNTMSNLSFIFTAIPFVYLIFLIINHLIISSNESGGDV